jgi:hypothetical protein
LNISMDTLTTPVLLVTIATNSREVRSSIGPSKCYIKKATEKLVSLSLRQSAYEVSLHQSVLEVRRQSSEVQSVGSEKLTVL